ncbi:MAG TPA: ATP-binding protein [Puia sp.]|nr:ATP-binding protein [Puia sp.]
MKKIFIAFLLLLYLRVTYSQTTEQYDSLKILINSAKDDSTRFYKTVDLVWDYIYSNMDSAALYIRRNILLAKKINSEVMLGLAYGQYWTLEQLNGNYSGAIQYNLQSLRLAERKNDFISICELHFSLGDIYREVGDFERSISNLRTAKLLLASKLKPVFEQEKNDTVAGHYVYDLVLIAQTFEKFNHLDSALSYAKRAHDLDLKKYNGISLAKRMLPLIMGNVYLKKGDYPIALSYYRTGVTIASEDVVIKDAMDNYSGMAATFKSMGQLDSSIFYANKVLGLSESIYNVTVKLDALGLLAAVYKLRHNTDSVAKYLDLTIETKDSLFNTRKVIEMQNIAFNETLRQQEIKEKQEQYKSRLRTYGLAGGLIVVVLIAGILYRNNRQKQKAKVKIEEAYKKLKNTQAQLIQSEKMASLGELTAGVAHEIQNPLNFVNNFSEVNMELLTEAQAELDRGDLPELKSILNMITENQGKISNHGKRAAGIVKGMLLHSRAGAGEKTLADLNTIVDECLKLSYHNMRTKDKSFGVKIDADFDQSIGKFEFIPQDMVRLFVNLFNNAFYAVAEKRRQLPNEYVPEIFISTRKVDHSVLVIIKDNGMGIPDKIRDKIFQPFFTTKPTGQGTGLGLSLSYDIVKAHGGDIRMKTEESRYTEFTIILPQT